MTKDEALQMCLEYIETDAHERRYVRWAINEALAQPAQEPVAIEYWVQNTVESGCWVKTRIMTKAEAEKLLSGEFGDMFSQGRIIEPPPPTPQPAQEPVAWRWQRLGQEWILEGSIKQTPIDAVIVEPLYTHPPQRTWVGLTEKDFSAINQSCLTKLQAATSAESILKKKNT